MSGGEVFPVLAGAPAPLVDEEPVEVDGTSMCRIEKGRLAEAWVQHDKSGIAQQIGMG